VAIETAQTPDFIDANGQLKKGVPAYRVIAEIYYPVRPNAEMQILATASLLEAMERSRDESL
jgi:hypothetical protein